MSCNKRDPTRIMTLALGLQRRHRRARCTISLHHVARRAGPLPSPTLHQHFNTAVQSCARHRLSVRLGSRKSTWHGKNVFLSGVLKD